MRLEAPAGKRIARVELLRAEKTVLFERRGNTIEFVFPTANDNEVATEVAG